MVRVKETVGGQKPLGATAAPDCPLQYCVSMLSDATQPTRVRECGSILAISFLPERHQLPGSPPTPYGVIHRETGVYTQNSFSVLSIEAFASFYFGFLRTNLL
jgi:hypothetical protein